jgi:hypothetical protein
MMEHPDPRLFSALLDGGLSPSELEELDGHLEECTTCTSLLQDLQDIRRQAEELPDRSPSKDLWPGIEAAIRTIQEESPDVIRLHPRIPASTRGKNRKLHLSIPQAVAAGLALALFSGLLGSRVGMAPSASPAGDSASASLEEVPPWVSQVSQSQPSLGATAREVANLEGLLHDHREDLDPNTSLVIQKNLQVIDRAIRESIVALQNDPGNRFLEKNLERAVLAKGEYLRDAASLVVPAT